MAILLYCLDCIEYCQKAAKSIVADPMHTETMQKTCEGLSRIFTSIEKDFVTISKLAMKGFTKKEIKELKKQNG